MGSRRWSIYPSWASGAPAPCGKTAGLPLGLGPCCHAAGHLKFPAQENRRISLATGLYIEPKTAVSPPNLGILTIFGDLHVSQRPTSSKSPRETPFPTSPRPVSPPSSPPTSPPTRLAQSQRARHSPDAPSTASADASGTVPTHPPQPPRARRGPRRARRGRQLVLPPFEAPFPRHGAPFGHNETTRH